MRTKGFFQSKINVTALISVVATLGAAVGLDLEPQTQANLATTVTAVGGAATVVFRTWFTNTTIG